jgi:hypothetical protein
MLPTAPSAFGLSFLSVITDKKDYRRKYVIGNLSLKTDEFKISD